MKNKIIIIILFIFLFSALYMIFLFKGDKEENREKKNDFITILWADWAPAEFLQELSREFTRETGIKVEIVRESWSTWQDVFFGEAEKKGSRFDMVIGDSQ